MNPPSDEFLLAAAQLDVSDGPSATPSDARTAIDGDLVWEALSTVIDPEIGLDIVTLGLVYEVELVENAVRVTFSLTTPGCPMQEAITGGVVNAVSAVPGVEHVLRNPVMRKTMGRLATVEQAARVAGIDPDELVERLNHASGADPESKSAAAVQAVKESRPPEDESMSAIDIGIPPALAHIPADRVVDLDVREDLRNGQEPFSRIMAARREVPPGGVLCLRAIFEPAPLYAVMAKQGFDHWTEKLAEDDWRVWFYTNSTPTSPPPQQSDHIHERLAPCPSSIGKEGVGEEWLAMMHSVPATTRETGAKDEIVILDVRGMEPPEPMVRTLAALEELPPGKTLLQINERVPRFLLPKLEELGFTYEIGEQHDALIRVFIRRRMQSTGDPVGTDRRRPRPLNHEEKHTMSETTREPMQLDVRVIPPREKHPTIFQTFDALESGESFVLVNDHDPFPLRYQFDAERKGQFGWEYLEQGPQVWRVEISKR